MNSFVLFSAILITIALIFYSIGVWAERLSRYLKKWHVMAFWTGFIFDLSGTLAMGHISDDPFNLLDIHTLTGQIALWLMLFHAIWATFVVSQGQETVRKKFHSYSIIVWLIWLVPYIGGVLMGMGL
jgi:uncharacterized repeat protein (TIGR03987 family)